MGYHRRVLGGPKHASRAAPGSVLLILTLAVCIAIPVAAAAGPGTFAKLSADAEAARNGNHLDEALQLYKKALKIKPNWAEGWWAVATLHYDRNEYAKAAPAFQRVVALQPKSGTAWVLLGLCEFQLGEDEQALKHIQKGNQLGTTPDLQFRNVMYFHEAVLQIRGGHFERAQDELEYLVESGLKNDDLVRALGMAVLRVPNEKSLPARITTELIQRAGHAQLLAAQKKHEEARQEYQRLVDEFPQAPNVNYAFGRFLLAINREQEGIPYFEREISLSPNHVPAWLSIAAVKYRVDSEDGIKFAEQAVKLAPGLPIANYLLGLLLLDAEKPTQAIPHLELAQRKLPEEPKVYFALGSAYSKVGRKNEAARARSTFARLNTKPRPQGSELGSVPSAEGEPR
jgi:tetratricopeptide (TPR) repeat protein